MKLKYNTNVAGLIIVLIGFVWSSIHVARISLEKREENSEGGKRIVRLVHWQLEPGYREALDHAIEEYNNLPKVREANVEVRQMAISFKVYPQFINVHLISGTAPDLSVKGGTQLVNAQNTGVFYEPIAQWISSPNPYNRPEALPDDLPEEVHTFLSTAPWRETFVDGMKAGYDWSLKDFYAVPVTTFGSTRIFYNREIMGEAKAIIGEAHALPPEERPEWFTKILFGGSDSSPGYMPDNERLAEWARTDEPPQTLGQFFLTCEAIREYARRIGDDRLVPIASSSNSAEELRTYYLRLFTYDVAQRLAYRPIVADGAMTYLYYRENRWDFESQAMQEYFDMMRAMSTYLPVGFLGLDRDQANRRFVLGRAGMIPGGGQDVQSIHTGASSKANPEDVFEVGVIRFPLPAEDERWADYIPGRAGETGTFSVSFAIYKKSKNKEWAIDFLRYLTSVKVNEAFAANAGWLPVVVGAEPSERMAPFMPDPKGVSQKGLEIVPADFSNQITTIFKGNVWPAILGDKPWDQFTEEMDSVIRNEHTGIESVWKGRMTETMDGIRSAERALSAIEASEMLLDEKDAATRSRRYRILFYDSAQAFSGEMVRERYERVTGEEFPED